MNTKNHPGVYVPPPLLYVTFFFVSVLLQKVVPLRNSWLHTTTAKAIGWLLIAGYLVFFITALLRFLATKNTVITIKPAASLETRGIYAHTRNPMYLSLLFLYSGIAIFYGNAWTFLLLPLLVLVIQEYVIRREEAYLGQAFSTEYPDYKKRVRRWL
jgi:protein-S-isoprenylcysteine O-methyltransferase Ste14